MLALAYRLPFSTDPVSIEDPIEVVCLRNVEYQNIRVMRSTDIRYPVPRARCAFGVVQIRIQI